MDWHGDPLVAINASVPDLLRTRLKMALTKCGRGRTDADRKSTVGRKPSDEVKVFNVLVLQALYNLLGEPMECQFRNGL